jgi:hypothetical protein
MAEPDVMKNIIDPGIIEIIISGLDFLRLLIKQFFNNLKIQRRLFVCHGRIR